MDQISNTNIKYEFEILPRYGSKVGIIWKIVDSELQGNSRNVIGQIRLEDTIEEQIWEKLTESANKLREELESLS